MELIIIRGVPGAGKTTFAEKLLQLNQADAHFEADQYFVRPDGYYDFNARLLPRAHEWCLRNVESALSSRRVIVSNTFTRVWEMQAYLDLAVRYNVSVKMYRCEGRFKNVHGVPDEKVQAMRDRFEDFAGEIIVSEL